MGLTRAAAGAVSGTLADSWLEYITAGDMGANTVLTRGVQIKRGKHGSNTKGTPDIISNGSRIEVGPNQMMILVDSGRIVTTLPKRAAMRCSSPLLRQCSTAN